MAYYGAQVMVDGWVELNVEADSEEEARQKMNTLLENMDFGELRDVAWDGCGFELEEC